MSDLQALPSRESKEVFAHQQVNPSIFTTHPTGFSTAHQDGAAIIGFAHMEADQVDDSLEYRITHTVKSAIEMAGINPAHIQGNQTSLYLASPAASVTDLNTPGSISPIGIAAEFGISGPAMSLDVGKASALLALHKAKVDILQELSRYVIVIGMEPNELMGTAITAVILCPNTLAERHNNHVFGVHRGSAINMSQPFESQEERIQCFDAVVEAAHQDAGLSDDLLGVGSGYHHNDPNLSYVLGLLSVLETAMPCQHPADKPVQSGNLTYSMQTFAGFGVQSTTGFNAFMLVSAA